MHLGLTETGGSIVARDEKKGTNFSLGMDILLFILSFAGFLSLPSPLFDLTKKKVREQVRKITLKRPFLLRSHCK